MDRDTEQLENFPLFLRKHFAGNGPWKTGGNFGQGGAEATDEIDGDLFREYSPPQFDGPLPPEVVPEFNFSREPATRKHEGGLISGDSSEFTCTPIQEEKLERVKEAEANVLKGIPEYKKEFDFVITDVEISNGVKVHTAYLYSLSKSECQASSPPIVMLHGTGGGIPCFHKIYGHLVQRWQIYAIDIPGFGSSSRINYSDNLDTCEDQLVAIIESWRVSKKLKKMILFGHSFGAYISALYAIKHYECIDHLVLVDSWGLLSKDEHVYSQGLLYEIFRKFCEGQNFNPMKYFPNLGPTIGRFLVDVYMSNNSYGDQCMEYLRRACTTGEMSGLKALLVLSDFQVDYPLFPMKKRLLNRLRSLVEPTLPITFIQGEKSNYKNSGGEQVRDGAKKHPVTVMNVPDAGHHVHADNPEMLVKLMFDFVVTN